MPFNPELLIPIVLFTFLFIIFSRMIKNRHELKKMEVMKRLGEGEQSLTTSELNLMIDDAVARATSDLEDRLEYLERARLSVAASEDQDSITSDLEKTLGRRPKESN